MENNQFNLSGNSNYAQTNSNVKTFMSNVFSWMFLALIVTSVTAWWFATDLSLLSMLVTEEGKMSILGWVVMLAPIGFVLLMSFAFNRLSYTTLIILFLTYAALVGVSMSFILLAYTLSSVFLTFAITAGMFGTMAVVGYTTKTDLTSFGKIMMMGLVGILIATIVNMFMQSSMLHYIISYVGVAVFTGLTAYDVQKLKMIGEGTTYGEENTKKLSILGALTLYLDFINLFLMLLRLFGGRKN
jgi:FtsH-binding integral membrane protein